MKTILISFLIGLLAGSGVTYWWDHRTGKTETAAPEVRQKDNSLVLERKPGATIHKPNLMKGIKVERQIEVNIQPNAQGCPICTADLTVVESHDGSRRVIASSPTGTVLGGLDVPMMPRPAPEKLWAGGFGYGGSGMVGAWIERDIGFFRFGADLLIRNGSAIPMMRAGWRW